jgi:broad specificity phosphatase PhoE
MGAKLDSPLSEKGIELAKQKGIALRAEGFRPNRVYTSSLLRAKQTARIILDEIGVDARVIELSDLNERDFGKHEGKPYKSVLDAFEKEGANPATVETVDIFVQRVLRAFEHIKDETTGTTLIVTHSNPEMVLQTAIENPDNILKFWELGDPHYCEGFAYEFK